MVPGAVKEWADILWQFGWGFTVACVAFIVLLARGIVTWGYQTKAERLEKEQWREAALAGTAILKAFVTRAERRS